MSENKNPNNESTTNDNQTPIPASADAPTVDLGTAPQAQAAETQQPVILPETPAWAGANQADAAQAGNADATASAQMPFAAPAKKERKPVSWLTPLWASVAAAGIAVVAFGAGAGTVAAVEAVQHGDRSVAQGSEEWGGRDGGRAEGYGPQGGMGGGQGGMGGGPQGGMPGEAPGDMSQRGQSEQSDTPSQSEDGTTDSSKSTDKSTTDKSGTEKNSDSNTNSSSTTSSSTQGLAWVLVS